MDIANRVSAYKTENPDADIIRLGIGDVTRPLSSFVMDAMKRAADEMTEIRTFRGYPPGNGYPFLLNAVKGYYASFGVELEENDIFISDGAKSDAGNIVDIFDKDNTVLVPDPVYPVYVDTNIMSGRKIVYAAGTPENGFLPMPADIQSDKSPDMIYICSPNNPTGAVYSRDQLKIWVDYANARDAVILFDAAYEAFVSTPDLPRSIFEIPGSKDCAIEFCSLSKTAGFTGIRCGYTVIPSSLKRDGTSINALWNRRQGSKFNGVSYPVQRAAEAVFTPQGIAETRESINYYRKNASVIAETMDKLGIMYTGGVNSPYVWLRCPGGMESWDFFDLLLKEANVVGTPGSGFGKNGTSFFRLTAFGEYERTKEAMERFSKLVRGM